MNSTQIRAWLRACSASVAAGVVSVSIVSAEPAVTEPDGMPVYRQKKTGFFQNPFSTSYQRLWNKAKGAADESAAKARPVIQSAGNAAHAAADQPQVVTIDGKQYMVTADDILVEVPANKASSAVKRHTVRKPTARPTATRTQTAGKTPAGKVVHVKNVNEGTPPIGVEYDVAATDDITKSLAEGEQIVSVKERVVGVYRNGKLVPVEATTPSSVVPHRVAKPVKKDIDPWFGDAVPAPTDESETIDATEAAPPQSMNGDLPQLPSAGETVEPTGVVGEIAGDMHVPSADDLAREASRTKVEIGELASTPPAEPTPPAPIKTGTLRKYQPTFTK